MEPSHRLPACPSASVLAAFGAGTLGEAEQDAVKAHVAGCAACGRSGSDAFAPTLVAVPPSKDPAPPPPPYPSAPGDVADLPAGARVQRYEIRARLGAGGMGTVYEAFDPDLDRPVALKILKADISQGAAGEELRQRMLREARAMARLSHPNVVTVYEAGTFGDQLFIAMELVRGTTLRDWLAKKPRSVREVLGAYAEAGAGLAAAHEAGLVHRDFKPDNVLVGDDGRVRVTDFGLARAHGSAIVEGPISVDALHRLVDSGTSDKLTRSGVMVGTPAYMSPEQFGGGETDARSDIFAFSVALYESVYGVRPFDGATLIELMKNTLGGRVTEPPRGHTVPPAVRRTLLRGLDTSREHRPASMRAMLAELALDEHTPANRWRWPAFTVFFVAAGAAALFAVRSHRGRIPASDRHRPVFAVVGFRPNAGHAGDEGWLGGAIARTVAAEIGAGERAQALSPDDLGRKGMAPLADTDLDRAASRRLGDSLGAGYLLLGSYEVQGAPDTPRLVIEARVVEASSGKTLREAREKGTLSAARELSLTVADDLGAALGLRELSGEERSAVRATLPTNPDAMRFYAGGLDRVLAFDGLGARALFEKAVAAEPSAPMPHAALARVLSELGYKELAGEEARAALDRSSGLARADRLSNEALLHELSSEWDKAAEIDRALFTFFPDDLEYGLRLADALIQGGKAADARETIEGLRGLVTTASDRVRVDTEYAYSLRLLDEPARMVEVAREAAATAQAMGSPHLRARALHVEALAHIRLNETEVATRLETEAREEFLAAGDKGPAAKSEQTLGELRADGGDLEGAQKLMEEALSMVRALGEIHAMSGVLGDLLVLQKRQENYEAARTLATESEQIGFTQSPQERATNLYNHGELLYLVGDLAGARAKIEETLTIRRSANDRRGTAFSLAMLAEIALAQGDVIGAARSVEEASAIDLKDQRVRAIVAMTSGLLALERRHPESAIEAVTAACETHRTGHRIGDEAWCRTIEARLLVAAGRRTEAIGVLDQAAPLLAEGADRRAARLLGVEDAYVRGLVAPQGARTEAEARLEALASRARGVGCIGDELDARLARALLATGPSARRLLASVARDATAGGFTEIAAHAARRQP